jgi:hypothetical protein
MATGSMPFTWTMLIVKSGWTSLSRVRLVEFAMNKRASYELLTGFTGVLMLIYSLDGRWGMLQYKT